MNIHKRKKTNIFDRSISWSEGHILSKSWSRDKWLSSRPPGVRVSSILGVGTRTSSCSWSLGK